MGALMAEQCDKTKLGGMLCRGKWAEAINYLERFPEKADDVAEMKRRTRENIVRTDDSFAAEIDGYYQTYYRMIFWEGAPPEKGVDFLLCKLMPYVDEGKLKQLFQKYFGDLAESKYADLELRLSGVEEELVPAFKERGLNFLGGTTQGYFGPYIWKTTTPVTYDVELPSGIQQYRVQMMDDFISRSWTDYISGGKTGTGGWSSGGEMYCVAKSYKDELDKPSFQISFLKHEAQHAYDNAHHPDMSTTILEYRAKLVELCYYQTNEIFYKFLAQASDSDKSNSHAYASYLIICDLSKKIFAADYVGDSPAWEEKNADIQVQSRELLLSDNRVEA